MWQRVITNGGSGGSSGAVSGSFDSYTAGEIKTIDTGLSTVNKFCIHMLWLRGSVYFGSGLSYNKSYSSSKYSSYTGTSASTTTGYGLIEQTIGSPENNNYDFILKSISGGKVNVKFPGVSNNGSLYIMWYAE